MKAEIISTIDDNSIPQSIWDKLQDGGSSDTPFQNRYWLLAWLRTVGTNTKPFFIKLTEGEQIVGVIPLVIDSSSVGPLNFRLLRFAGQPNADYGDFLLGEDKEACLKAMLSFIFAHAHLWDVAVFEHLCETSPNLAAFLEVLEETAVPHDAAVQGVLPYAGIGSSFDEYWRRKSRNMRNDIASKGRHLEQQGKVTFKRNQGYEALQVFDSFTAMLKAGYTAKSSFESIATFEQEKSFLAALLGEAQLAPLIHFSSLSLDDVPIAYHFGFVNSRVYYDYKTCYSFQYARCSPGMLLVKELMLDCEQSSIGTVDFLLGDEPYKYRWANGERQSFNIRIFHKGWKSCLLRLWLAGIRPRLKKSDMLVNLVNKVRRMHNRINSSI